MPNRGELAIPTRRPDSAAAAVPGDAWPIVGFCAFGALMTIYMAVSFTAMDAVPRLLAQSPWG